jgi:hypothetical protein
MRKLWGTIIISIILIIAGCGLFIAYRPLTSITAEDLCDDWSVTTGTFDSYSEGDEVVIYDEINDIEYVPNHKITGEPVDWTFITLKSVDIKIEDVAMMVYNPSKLWGFFIFNGDLTDTFKKGDTVEIKVKFTNFLIGGHNSEILTWYKDLLNAGLNANDFENTTYGSLKMADGDNISHANLLPEIMFGIIIVIGIIILVIGIVRLRRLKKADSKISDQPQTLKLLNSDEIQELEPVLDAVILDQSSWHPPPSTPPPSKPKPEIIEDNADDLDEEIFRCPKCGNIMHLKIPNRPFECYCDKCGVCGIID